MKEILELLITDGRFNLIAKKGDGSDWINSYKRIVPVDKDPNGRNGIGYVMIKEDFLHIHLTKGLNRHLLFGRGIERETVEDLKELLNSIL